MCAEHEVLRLLGVRSVPGEHLVDDYEERVEAGLDRFTSVDGDVAVEDLLEDLSVGDEPLSRGDELLEQPLRVS